MPAPYRDDFDALKDRLASLQDELSAVQARTRELTELQETEAKLAREVDTLRRRLDTMTARRALPVLENIRIASPCKADWNAMSGDDRMRFCGECQKNVYNLSGMARDEAERLIRDSSAEMCVRLYRRADGTVLTSDCPVGARRVRRRKAVAATVGGGLLAAGAAFGWQETMVMGEIDAHAMMDEPTVVVVGAIEPDMLERESVMPEPRDTSSLTMGRLPAHEVMEPTRAEAAPLPAFAKPPALPGQHADPVKARPRPSPGSK